MTDSSEDSVANSVNESFSEVESCRTASTNFVEQASRRYWKINKDITNLQAEKIEIERLITINEDDLEDKEYGLSLVTQLTREIASKIAKRDQLKTLIQSFELSASAAMSGLEQENFDLWAHLYGFVIAGIKKAVFSLTEVDQQRPTPAEP
jgi:hypothetical protein